jgi:hypothetical protein
MRSTFVLSVLALTLSCVKRGDQPHDRRATPTAEQAVAQALAAALRDAGTVSMEDPATCAVCHPTVAAEFEQSLHRRSHHSADPLYAAMRAFRLAKEGPALATQCASCHSPRDVEDPESLVASRGVTCATCHQLAAVHQGLSGARALERGPAELMRGGDDLDAGASPLHETGPGLSALADGTTVCLACHLEDRNKAGLATCSTGVELASAAVQQPCTSCHMPRVEGPSGPVSARKTHHSHAFAGPHQAWDGTDTSLLASAVKLGGHFDGDRFVATLENASGHGFPTGFPARLAVLGMRGLDARGAEVWKNITGDPMKDQPEAVLNKLYVDAEGAPTLAPYGVKVARDSRLTPGERRTITVAVPANVSTVVLTLRFWLVAPMAATRIGVQGLEATPREVVVVKVAR